MSKTEKAPNYTEAQTAELRKAYQGASNDAERANIVQTFADKFHKAPRSIVAKLSREGVYQKPQKVSKTTGGKVAKKEELAEELAELARTFGVVLVSAEKLNKTDQVALIQYFKAQSEQEPEQATS